MIERCTNKIRVLIVDDFAGTRENIGKLLEFEPDFEVVGTATSGEDAIEVARETWPDVVLMDLSMPGVGGMKATEAIRDYCPSTQIVILSVTGEMELMTEAMKKGASDFLVKPPSRDRLVDSIRQAGGRSRKEKARELPPVVDEDEEDKPIRGKAIAIYSPKGGVGTTTLAINLAIGLNADETPTVLVDAALPFGNAPLFLNLQGTNSIADLVSQTEPLDPDVVRQVLLEHSSGLRVLAAPPRPELAEGVEPDHVRKVLEHLKREFAYVVIDTSPMIDERTVAILDLADLLVVVAGQDIPTIRNTRLLFDLLEQLPFPEHHILLVLNKVDRKSRITAQKIAGSLKHPVDGEIPFDAVAVTESVNKGVPLMLGDKTRTPTKNILELLATVKERLVGEKAASK